METEKAIEILKYELDKSKVCKKYQTHTVEFLKDLDDYIEAIQTVLKELNRKDRIINTLKIALKERTDERDRKDDQISKLRSVTTKQDKMIELMGEYIAKIDNDTEICQYENECDENCKRCVIQYFENKANEEAE